MITKPEGSFGWLNNYIDKVPEQALFEAFKRQTEETLRVFSALTEEQWDLRYQEGKWNLREMLVHLMDAERVFAYRALTFARHDKTNLPGFDEDEWVFHSHADARSSKSLIEEYMVVRTATVALFANLSPESTLEMGTGNGVAVNAAAMGFAILGHEAHHLYIVRTRYLQMD